MRYELLPAVMVPKRRSKAGRSLASPSMVESPRIPLSSRIAVPFGGTNTGAICRARLPSTVAAAARWFEPMAYVSCASRLIPYRFANRSQFSPMISPVENSANATGSGRRSLGPSPLSSAK